MTPDPKLRGALEPAWSELREQRLLGRIAEGRRQGAHRRRRRALLAGGALFVAGAAAAAIIGIHHGAEQLAARRPAATAPRLVLADGSEATLTPDGDVQIDEQTATRVRLRQRAGAARYVVRHDPGRDFLVTAGQVTVRVRGTIFSVVVRAGTVGVSVEQGRVEISDRLRTRDLVAGESLSVPSDGAAPAPPPPEATPPPAADERPEPTLRAAAAHPTGSELLARADAARAAGHSAEAARSLEAFASAHPRDPRLPAALFTLGRVEAARGQWQPAGEAFDRCAAARAGGPLAGDALAEGARAWHAAGVADRARGDARAYLAAHPTGPSAPAMRRLADD